MNPTPPVDQRATLARIAEPWTPRGALTAPRDAWI